MKVANVAALLQLGQSSGQWSETSSMRSWSRHTHTYPSQSKTSRLLSASLSLRYPIPPLHQVCALSPPPALALRLSLHRHPYLYVPPSSHFIRYDRRPVNRKTAACDMQRSLLHMSHDNKSGVDAYSHNNEDRFFSQAYLIF
jgi:hypothetical protein